MLPPDDRSRLLEKVRGGTGLVYICPPEIDEQLKDVIGEQSSAGREEILRGVPWRSLPRLRRADPQRLVRTGDYDSGRVVVLDYQQPFGPAKRRLSSMDFDLHSLTPAWVQTSRIFEWPRLEKAEFELGPYEYYQSLVARAVRWASGHSSSVELSAALPTRIGAGRETPVSLRARAASVSAAVRTDDGRQMFRANLPVRNGTASLRLPPLCAGQYLLDLWARDARACVLEWASRAFEVRGDNAVESVELASRLQEAGDRVRAKIRLAKPLSTGRKLRAELWDLYGRQIDLQEVSPTGRSGEVALGPLAPVHIMHELRAVISRGGRDLIEHRQELPVRAKLRFDDFASVVWVNVLNRNSLPTFHMFKRLHDMDEADAAITGGGRWRRRPAAWEFAEMELAARLPAMANLMVCPNGGFVPGFGPITAPKDTHVSELPWTGAGRLARLREQAQLDAEFYAPYGPFAWPWGTEVRYSYDPDVDWHPDALARFRRLLREELYPSLQALNQEWQTQYTAWDQAMPIELAEATRTGKYAPWVTHKLSSDAILADLCDCVSKTVRGIDKGARTGLDGDSGLYGPNFGYDWWRLSKCSQICQSYHSHACQDMQSQIKRSFSPADATTVRGMWYGTYGTQNAGRPTTIEYCHYHPWYSLFHHMNTEWFWTMGAPGPISGYAPDLTALPFMQSRTLALREIKSGIGKLILSCPRADDGIAIHFSESSRIADSLFAEKCDPWHSDYEDALGNVARALEDAGFQYRFVAYEEVEAGALQERGYRVFFLPHSQAVSDREAQQILAFGRAGGLVVADIVPATLTKTGAKRPASALERLFPQREAGAITRLGQGLTVLMGTDMLKGYYRSYNGRAGWRSFEGRWRRMADLLRQHAGLKPQVVVEPKQGEMPPTEIARFDADGIELIGLIRSAFLKDHDTYPAHIRLRRKSHLYDVRPGRYLGYADRCDKPLDYQAEVLALSPYEVEAVRVKLVGQAAPGKPLEVEIEVTAKTGRATGKHCLRLTVTGPDGRERKWYAQNVLAPGGRATAIVPLALNEAPGTYTIRAIDCMSRLAGEAPFGI